MRLPALAAPSAKAQENSCTTIQQVGLSNVSGKVTTNDRYNGVSSASAGPRSLWHNGTVGPQAR